MIHQRSNTPIPSTPIRKRSTVSTSPSKSSTRNNNNNNRHNVRVVVRIRPLNKHEINQQAVIYPILDEFNNNEYSGTLPEMHPVLLPASPISEQSTTSSIGNSIQSSTSSKRSFSFRRPKVLKNLLSKKNRDPKKMDIPTTAGSSSTINQEPANTKQNTSNGTVSEHGVDVESSKKVYPSTCMASNRPFDFDAVFGSTVTQHELYHHSVGDGLIPNLLHHGRNTTIIAYGMTGAGKSYTMSNVDGVIYHAVNDLFLAKVESNDHISVSLSCYEIYTEEVHDLLGQETNAQEPHTPLKLRDNGDNVSVVGLNEIAVDTVDQVRELLDHAQIRRTTSRTCSNERSSRSHAVYILTIQSSSDTNKGNTTKLTFVDLAGSERIKESGVIGNQRKESIHINKDLFVLAKVISSLHDRSGHIPYRDSKLTRLLRDSLGGTIMHIFLVRFFRRI
jgi:hypothetical protein